MAATPNPSGRVNVAPSSVSAVSRPSWSAAERATRLAK